MFKKSGERISNKLDYFYAAYEGDGHQRRAQSNMRAAMSIESKKRGIRKTVLPFAGASSTLSISLKESHKRKTLETHSKVNFDISPS